MVETFGSGVGVIDFDNDGQPDLFFANGADLAHGKPSPGNALYRNLGNGKFQDVTAKAGVAGNGMFATGVTVGDSITMATWISTSPATAVISSFATMATGPSVR